MCMRVDVCACMRVCVSVRIRLCCVRVRVVPMHSFAAANMLCSCCVGVCCVLEGITGGSTTRWTRPTPTTFLSAGACLCVPPLVSLFLITAACVGRVLSLMLTPPSPHTYTHTSQDGLSLLRRLCSERLARRQFQYRRRTRVAGWGVAH